MPLKMKELPETERPYEKLKLYGESKLSNAELLAIIIKTGTKDENSLAIANRILLLTNKLLDLQSLSLENLMTIKGIGEVKAIQIKAICELAKRMTTPLKNGNIKINEPKDVADLFLNQMKFERQEIVKVILLNTKNILLKIVDIAKGELNYANITTKQVLSEAVKMQVNKIIIVHNHPSGDPTPSKDDYEITKKIVNAADILGINVLDHIIIGDNSYESIFSRREFKNELFRI